MSVDHITEFKFAELEERSVEFCAGFEVGRKLGRNETLLLVTDLLRTHKECLATQDDPQQRKPMTAEEALSAVVGAFLRRDDMEKAP